MNSNENPGEKAKESENHPSFKLSAAPGLREWLQGLPKDAKLFLKTPDGRKIELPRDKKKQ